MAPKDKTRDSKDTEKQILEQTTIKHKRPKLKSHSDGIEIEGFDNSGADVTLTSQDAWSPAWLLQRVSTRLLGIRTLSQVQQSLKWIKCIGPEGTNKKVKTTCGRYSHELMGTRSIPTMEISIPPKLEIGHKGGGGSDKKLKGCYQGQL